LAFDKKELENKFHNPELSQDDINKLSAELQKIIDTIETKEERWLELSSMLED
jgi:ATP-binding cassette subfamily F protein uup